MSEHPDARRIEQSNEVAAIVQTYAEAFIPLTERYGIADALWAAGLRLPAHPDTEYISDAEWREYQAIPGQGYSHRHWVNSRIAERVSAERRRLLDNATIDHARIAVHQALASQWMTIVGALDGDQSRYDRLVTDIAVAVLADATVPREEKP